jgi:hypothetical protein
MTSHTLLANSTPMADEPPIEPTANKLIVYDNKVILGSHLDRVIKGLISKSFTEDGLEFATTVLLNISEINQAARDKVLHLLLDAIRVLGKSISDEIK